MGRRSVEPVRYAVVGAGNIAQEAVLPAFAHAKENSSLVALISSDETKQSVLGKRYRLGDNTGSYDELESIFERAEVEAAYIAVPNHLHCELTQRIAKLGVHVLCEKPMALNEAGCRAMIRAAEANSVKLMIAYRLHFERATLEAIQLARSGKLGELKIFSSVFSHCVRDGDIRTRSEAGGGALFDLGPYPINAARHLFADEPIEVYAVQTFSKDDVGGTVDDMTTAIVRFPGDRLAQFTVSQGASSVSSYRIVGDKGELRVEPGFSYYGALEHHASIEERKSHRSFGKRDQFAPELVYFSKCIRENLTPEPNGEEGLADVRVLEAIAESAKMGQPIALTPTMRTDRPTLDLAMRKPPVPKQKLVHAPSPSS